MLGMRLQRGMGAPGVMPEIGMQYRGISETVAPSIMWPFCDIRRSAGVPCMAASWRIFSSAVSTPLDALEYGQTAGSFLFTPWAPETTVAEIEETKVTWRPCMSRSPLASTNVLALLMLALSSPLVLSM